MNEIECKTDFSLLRKLEDKYDEAVEDLENKEEVLIKSVHREYLKAENKGEFFDGLQKSESWYYTKFREYGLGTHSVPKTEANIRVHQERKKQSLVDDLNEIKEKRIGKIEVAPELKDGTDYEEPDEVVDWVEDATEEIISTDAESLTTPSDFTEYQNLKNKLLKIQDISKVDFTKLSDKYKHILIFKLEDAIEHLTSVREELRNEAN